ncbi:MAG: N-acetyltransferase [Chitinophagaceae bacterium]|nr:MAG: N-acetyltransferase [Chitinophagaceae bacterium]
MKEEFQNLELTKNEAAQRFEMNVGNAEAFIVYRQSGNKITLIHTEVAPALEGKGAATAIIEKTLAYIAENNFKLIPLCPLVVSYLKRHSEWKRIVKEGINL